MYFVYILRSTIDLKKIYVGYTTNIKDRLHAHNSGYPKATSLHRPWVLETFLAFEDMSKAKHFEKYLKSHAGRAFGSKRLW